MVPSSPIGRDSGGRARYNLKMNPQIEDALKGILNYQGKGTSADEDALFEVHTIAALAALASAPRLMEPVVMWERIFRPAATEAEKRIGRPIHKGAPCYNTALCCFLMHDFDGAFQYLMDAHDENQRLGGNPFGILIGKHPLSRKFLIEPLVGHMAPRWATDYKAITGFDLTPDELIELMVWLSNRPSDAFVALVELHRVWWAADRQPENRATRLVAFRAVADLLVCLESAIRNFQGTAVTGQLYARMTNMLNADARVIGVFNSLKDFPAGQGETPAALNNAITEATNRFALATTESVRAGCVCFASYKLRNSLLHLNEEALDVHTNLNLAVRMAGWTLAAIRIARRAHESALGALT